MDLEALCGTIASSPRVVAVGRRTQWEVGGPPPVDAIEVGAPAGVVVYEPADLTITVGAGTTCAELATVLHEHRQQCPLDPRDADATIGGVLACGLSGLRRLRHGPLRDQVLEVRFVTADGRLVKGGGPTVKNVTGYDLPRLFVGSLGTLGVLTQATLRCRPIAAASRWIECEPSDVDALYRPAAVTWDGACTRVLLEGEPDDVAAQAAGRTECAPPAMPAGPHRGRVSVAPASIDALGDALASLDAVRWLAEVGVGTVHVAADTAAPLSAARAAAAALGGWMLREAGGDADDDGFGGALPNVEVMQRIKDAFDPQGKFAPGRLPL